MSNLRFVLALSAMMVNQVIAQEEVSPEKTVTPAGVVVADFDQDGDIDLYVTDVLHDIDVMLMNGLQHQRLGITTAAADATLKVQLELPDGKGLVVAHLEKDGPAAKAGVQLHDILLTADDTSLRTVDDLDVVINAVSTGTIDVQVLRAGATIPLQVHVVQPFNAVASEYFTDVLVGLDAYRIGVEVVPTSAALRAQLRLPKDQGLVINRFVPETGSPAEQAGIKHHDVLLSAAKSVLSSPDELRNVVETSEGKPITITLLRRGKRETLIVTPKKGDAFRSDNWLRRYVVPHKLGVTVDRMDITGYVFTTVSADKLDASPSAKMQIILKQLEELTASVKRLKSDLDSEDSSKDGSGEGAAESEKK